MILVTGGSGFVGRALMRSLQRLDEPVCVMTRRPQSRSDAGVERRAGDLADPKSLSAALRDVRAVVHLAGALGGSAATLEAVNAVGAAAFARAAAQAGVARFVHVSSAGVYGDHIGTQLLTETAELRAASPYELSKLHGERAVARELSASATRWVTLRPAGVYGGGRPLTQDFLHEVRRRRWWIHLPPRVWLHPTHVSDVVQAIECALRVEQPNGEVFNIAGARALAFDEWIDEVARVLGVKARQFRVPPGTLTPAVQVVGRALRGLRLPVPPQLVRASTADISRMLDISKARNGLGFVPLPLEEALAETLRASE